MPFSICRLLIDAPEFPWPAPAGARLAAGSQNSGKVRDLVFQANLAQQRQRQQEFVDALPSAITFASSAQEWNANMSVRATAQAYFWAFRPTASINTVTRAMLRPDC